MALMASQTPVKSRRKQQLIVGEMLGDEAERGCSPTPSDPHVFKFPKLDFGVPVMGKVELERALTDQLYLHSANEVNKTGIDHPNPQELTSDVVTGYQNHRLAVVSWFAKVIPFELVSVEKYHSVLIPAVNVMDRYLITCVDLGEDLCQLLKNIGNIRAACLSLSLKMHAVFTTFDLKDLHRLNDWVNEAMTTDSSSYKGNPRFKISILSDVRGIEEAEKRIISTLRGALFPANAENMIRILCKYLILERLSGQMSSSPANIDTLNRRVTEAAVKRLCRTTLDIKLLRFKRWKCIAACCLLEMLEVCDTNPKAWLRLEDSLISLLDKLKPGELTQEELSDLNIMLVRDCVVCSSNLFVNHDVYKCLCKISSMSCPTCRKNLLVRGNTARSVTEDPDDQEMPNKVARSLVVL